jgi:predicted nucleic-acid-binding Zn-ribbon protein
VGHQNRSGMRSRRVTRNHENPESYTIKWDPSIHRPMTPSSTSDDDATEPSYLVCGSCGAKASTSWSFCRSCQSSLEDAKPAEEGANRVLPDDAPPREEAGCPKCGFEEAEIDKIATTGTGLSKLFDLQNRTFHVVACTNCGYTEFYQGQDADVILDLFLG